MVDHQRLGMQTIGFNLWADGLPKHGDLLHEALKTYEIATLKRVGFKTKANLDLGLTNAELRKLLYGSFLPPQSHFPASFGKTEDALIQLDGVIDDNKYQLVVTAFNEEQAKVDFVNTPNIRLFESEPGDTLHELSELRITIGGGLLVDVDVFRSDLETNEIRHFLNSSLEISTRLTDASVALIKSLPARTSA